MTPPARATLTYAQILKIALDSGFRRDGSGTVIGDSADTITAIALAESGGDTQAVGPQTVNADARGLLQINMKSHGAPSGPVTLDCAYTPACAMAFAYGLSQGGRKFTDWTVFNTGAYKSHLEPKTQPADTNAGGDPRTGGGGVGSTDPPTGGGGGGFLGISPDEMKRFGAAVAVTLAASFLVAIGAWGIVNKSDAGAAVASVAKVAALA